MKTNTVISSYLFFALFVFNTLALLSAEFLPIFSQVFMLLVQDGRIYDIFSCILVAITFLMTIAVSIKVYKKKTILGRTAPTIVIFMAFLILCVLAFTFQWLCQKFFTEEDIAFFEEENVALLTWQSYYTSIEFIVLFFCCFFLVVLPLLYRALQLHFNLENRISRSLFILRPSVTTILIIMSANAFHPYFSDLPSRVVQLIFFFVAGILFIYIFLNEDMELGTYEFINGIILIFMILSFILCSDTILHSDFLNAQFTFFMLGLFSWCSEWVYNEEILNRELNMQ